VLERIIIGRDRLRILSPKKKKGKGKKSGAASTLTFLKKGDYRGGGGGWCEEDTTSNTFDQGGVRSKKGGLRELPNEEKGVIRKWTTDYENSPVQSRESERNVQFAAEDLKRGGKPSEGNAQNQFYSGRV